MVVLPVALFWLVLAALSIVLFGHIRKFSGVFWRKLDGKAFSPYNLDNLTQKGAFIAVKLKKIQRKTPVNATLMKWYLTQESAGSVSMQEIAKEIEGRTALSLGDVQSVLSNLME
jgi:hypothetical protein